MARVAEVIRQSCFTTEARGWAKHLSGNENNSLEKGGEPVLIGYGVSSLVVDWLCDQAKGQSIAVACFYFDFAARKEQSATSMLSSRSEEHTSELLTWLSPFEPRLRHQDIQERRVANVGEWLLQTKEFRSWHDRSGESGGDKAVLFCYGGPGVGKTFIR